MRTIMNPFRTLQQIHRSTRSARPARRRTNALRPAAPELLEDRTVLTGVSRTTVAFDFVVASLHDSGKGTLRAAINRADRGAATNSYVIDIVTPGTIKLNSALPDLSRNITINGLGASTSTVRGSAFSRFRIFKVDAGATVTVSGLRIGRGNAGSGNGGGIDNFGTLTVSGSSFTSNSARFGGGLANESGGTATVSDCTFSSNFARVDGGAIKNFGTLITHNATLTGDGEANRPNGIS
jgi:predicted outer membrane repeat protein